MLSWFSSSIRSIVFLLPFFSISMVYFSIQNSILISWLYILIVSIRVAGFFSNLVNILILFIHKRCFIYSYDYVNLLFPIYFLRIYLSTIIVITERSGNSEFASKILLWIFTSAKVWPPANLTFQVSMVIMGKF